MMVVQTRVREEGWKEVIGLWIRFRGRVNRICQLVSRRLREKEKSVERH